MVLVFILTAVIFLTSPRSFANQICHDNILRAYVAESKEFNDAKKISARINKQLRPLSQEISESYKLGTQMRNLEDESRRLSLLSPQTTEMKNKLHDLELAHAALKRDLIDRNNRFILKMQELFKKQGIPSEVVTTLDDTQAWRMFPGPNASVEGREVLSLRLSLEAPATTNQGFNYYRRVQKIFGIESVTLSLSDPTGMGAGGIFFPQVGRLEIGPMGAVNLLREYINVIGKHESRHAMFQGKRLRGEGSLFHSQFQASPSGNLLNEVHFYEQYMSAEELYTFSTDLQSLAQVFKGDFLIDEAKKLSLLSQIKDGTLGLQRVATTTKEVTAKMIESLEKKLLQNKPTLDVGLRTHPNGAFDMNFTDELGRSAKLSFVSDAEKELLTSYQAAISKLSERSDEYILKRFTEEGIDVEELGQRLGRNATTADEQQKIISLNQEFMQLPEAKALNQNQMSAYRNIVVAAKTRMEQLNQLATIQVREAGVLERMLNEGTGPAQIETIRAQMFMVGKNVKEDYKGFGLKSDE